MNCSVCHHLVYDPQDVTMCPHCEQVDHFSCSGHDSYCSHCKNVNFPKRTHCMLIPILKHEKLSITDMVVITNILFSRPELKHFILTQKKVIDFLETIDESDSFALNVGVRIALAMVVWEKRILPNVLVKLINTGFLFNCYEFQLPQVVEIHEFITHPDIVNALNNCSHIDPYNMKYVINVFPKERLTRFLEEFCMYVNGVINPQPREMRMLNVFETPQRPPWYKMTSDWPGMCGMLDSLEETFDSLPQETLHELGTNKTFVEMYETVTPMIETANVRDAFKECYKYICGQLRGS